MISGLVCTRNPLCLNPDIGQLCLGGAAAAAAAGRPRGLPPRQRGLATRPRFLRNKSEVPGPWWRRPWHLSEPRIRTPGFWRLRGKSSEHEKRLRLTAATFGSDFYRLREGPF